MRHFKRLVRKYALGTLGFASLASLYYATTTDNIYVSSAPEAVQAVKAVQEARKDLPEDYEDCLYIANVYIIDASGKEIGKKGPAVPFLSYPDDVICMPTDMLGFSSQDTNLYLCYSNNPSSSFTAECKGYAPRTETFEFGKNTHEYPETKIIFLKPLEEAK